MMWSALLDTTLAYERQQPAPDSAGGTTRTWKRLLARLPCAIQAAGTEAVTRYAERGITVDFQIYATANLDALIFGGVRTGDRLNPGDGTYYVIRGVRRDQNKLLSPEPLYAIDCQKLIE